MRQGTSLGRVYLDIETTEIKPGDGEIVSIQTVPLDDPRRQLTVRRAWKHPKGEAGIVQEFFEWSRMATSRWHLIPVGTNLGFEWKWLYAKGVKYGCLPFGSRFEDFGDRPSIDLQPILVAFNNMELSGSRLSDWTTKRGHGGNAAEFAKGRRWAELDEYIRDETLAFIELYDALKVGLPEAWNSIIKPKIGGEGGATNGPNRGSGRLATPVAPPSPKTSSMGGDYQSSGDTREVGRAALGEQQ